MSIIIHRTNGGIYIEHLGYDGYGKLEMARVSTWILWEPRTGCEGGDVKWRTYISPYCSLRNLGRGLFFSHFMDFQQVICPELNFDRISLEVGMLESHSKSAVNAIPVFLMPSKNEISTVKSLSSASHLQHSEYYSNGPGFWICHTYRCTLVNHDDFTCVRTQICIECFIS